MKKGVRVVIINEKEARRHFAIVHNGQRGTIGEPRSNDLDNVNVHLDGDPGPRPWAVPIRCVRRLHRRKVIA